MRLLSIAIAAALAGGASAQNTFEIFPDRPANPLHIKHTRLGLGTLGGEILMEVPDWGPSDNFFRGVGRDCSGGCRVQHVEVHVKDLDASTPEILRLVLRNNVPIAPGGPNMTGSGIYQSPWMSTPPDLPVGPMDFVITAPCDCVSIPCSGGFSIGVELRPAPAYPLDGLEVRGADYLPVPFPGTGDFPNIGSPSYAWTAVNSGAAVNSFPLLGWALSLSVQTCDAPVLNMGGVGPPRPAVIATSYGVGGMWPGACRGDGVASRVTHLPHAGGMAWLGIAASPGNLSLVSFGVCEDLLLDPASMSFVALGALDGNGTNKTLLIPVTNCSFVGMSAWFQAFTIGPTFTWPIRVTNAQRVQF